MNAAALLAAAREAAEALAKAPVDGVYRYIQLGTGLPVEVIEELAKLAGVSAFDAGRASAMGDSKPRVIVSVDIRHAGILCTAQGSREPTAEELRAVTVYPREVVEDRAADAMLDARGIVRPKVAKP